MNTKTYTQQKHQVTYSAVSAREPFLKHAASQKVAIINSDFLMHV